MPDSYPATVKRVEQLNAVLKRITFGFFSPYAKGEEHAGDYLKLHLLDEHGQTVKRTYTIRSHRVEDNEIDVDFVIHGTNGLASAWAMQVQVGDQLELSPPGRGRWPAEEHDWLFIAGDLTALPAISVILERLPEDATGYVVIETSNVDEVLPLNRPVGMQLHWMTPTGHEPPAIEFVRNLRALEWLDGNVAVWAASEFDTMRAMRRYFKKERGTPTANAYISSYWKRGVREDEHKKIKKADTDLQAKL